MSEPITKPHAQHAEDPELDDLLDGKTVPCRFQIA